jgi:CheY-like chemotaxis protein
MRVLAVDDPRDNADVMVMLLEATGHVARAAYSGAEALAALWSGDFDAVILDVELQDMHGTELANEIRADPRTRGVAIAFATGRPEREVRGWFDGYAAFLQKPLLDGLDDALRRLELEVASRTARPTS